MIASAVRIILGELVWATIAVVTRLPVFISKDGRLSSAYRAVLQK
jgi:hypothetical protein